MGLPSSLSEPTNSRSSESWNRAALYIIIYDASGGWGWVVGEGVDGGQAGKC